MEKLQNGDPRQVGGYTLLGRLGADGMGRAFLGQSAAGGPVMVRVIYPHLAADPGFRVRLAREADAARRVDGAFTAPLIDFDADAPLPWLVSAYVDGPPLAAVVATRGPLSVRSVLTLAAGLAQALRAAHAAEVVHGDLNPARVLLAADGARIIDFGIARAVDRGLAGIGMPDFMAPEQAAGLEAGPASDMFSLGAVLLYATAGAWMSHFVWHLDQLPGELRPLIERCMAADPARRPTAREFLAELPGAYPAAVSPGATAPYGVWPAQGGTPAPPLPAQAIRAGARKVNRRLVQVIAVAALALAVGIAGAVYVIHPWPYPVLPPAGLTADQRGTNSISLNWSPPEAGPLPDKYVILRNGTMAGTVPGNVDHFKDDGLAPASTYDFQVLAYRGSTRSQPSPGLRAATQTPPLSQAVFNSAFSVTEKVLSGGSSVSGDADGDTYHDAWTFTSDCAVGPCITLLSGSIDGEPFSATLKVAGDGSYTGSVPINDYLYCGNDQTNYVDTTLLVSVKPVAAGVSMGQWTATKLTGSVDWLISDSADGTCGGGQMSMSIAG